MDIIDLPDEPWRPKRQKTALEKLQEDLTRSMEPLRNVFDAQETLRQLSPDFGAREVLKQFDHARQAAEFLDKTSVSKQLLSMINGDTIAAQAQKLLAQLTPGMDNGAWRHLTAADSLSAAVKQHAQREQEWLKNFQQQASGILSAQDFAKQYAVTNPTISAMEAARKSLDGILGQLRSADFSRPGADKDDEQEAEEAATSIGKAAFAEPTIQAAVDQIVAAISAQQSPTVQLMLWFAFRKVLDWLIAGAIGAVMGVYATNLMADSPQGANKAVKEVARDAIGAPELLEEYRYVSAQMLVIRQGPKARSPEIARLKFGAAVQLLKKEKDFALVLWTDQAAGTQVQGWVFSRYLKKFN